MGFVGVDYVYLSEVGTCEHGYEILVSIKYGYLLNY
jgi:hypothetical protein